MNKIIFCFIAVLFSFSFKSQGIINKSILIINNTDVKIDSILIIMDTIQISQIITNDSTLIDLVDESFFIDSLYEYSFTLYSNKGVIKTNLKSKSNQCLAIKIELLLSEEKKCLIKVKKQYSLIVTYCNYINRWQELIWQTSKF